MKQKKTKYVPVRLTATEKKAAVGALIMATAGGMEDFNLDEDNPEDERVWQACHSGLEKMLQGGWAVDQKSDTNS